MNVGNLWLKVYNEWTGTLVNTLDDQNVWAYIQMWIITIRFSTIALSECISVVYMLSVCPRFEIAIIGTYNNSRRTTTNALSAKSVVRWVHVDKETDRLAS